MTYDSEQYWNERVHPNKQDYPGEVEFKVIPPFLKGASSILELGPGDGRLFCFYRGSDVIGVDFSTLYKTQCLEKAEEIGLNYKHVEHNVHLEDLPFEQNAFQKGLLIYVLLHAPELECERIIEEMAFVCEEVLIICTNETTDHSKVPHCFSHNYGKILKSKKLEYTTVAIKDQIAITYKSKYYEPD